MGTFHFKQTNMNKILYTISFSVLFYCMTFAQSEVLVQKRLFKIEPQHAFTFSVERSDVKDKEIVKMWNSYLKNFNSKPDFDKDLQMEVAEEVQIEKISSDPLRIYMRKSNISDAQTEFVVWLQNSKGNFIGNESTDGDIRMAKQWVLEYGICIKRHQITERLEENQDDLESLVKDKEKLTEKLEDSQEEIEDLKKEIEKLKKDIEKEKENIDEVNEELPEVEAEIKKKQTEVDKFNRQLQELKALKERA